MKLAILTALALFQTSTAPTRQTVLVINGTSVAQNIYWHQDQSLQRYALSHPGTYIAFATAGTIYRVDSPEAMQQVQTLYAPLAPLAAEQEKLAAQQKPLTARMAELQKQMKTAVGPENVGKVGQLMGELGQQQGRIGEQQGIIGRRQGAAAQTLQAAIDKIADTCLADKSCPAVK